MISQILREDITPTLQNLEKERTHYAKFMKNQTDINDLSRVSIAYEYDKARKLMDNSTSGVDDLEKRKEEATKESKQLQADIDKRTKKLKDIIGKKEEEMSGGYRQVEKRVSPLHRCRSLIFIIIMKVHYFSRIFYLRCTGRRVIERTSQDEF